LGFYQGCCVGFGSSTATYDRPPTSHNENSPRTIAFREIVRGAPYHPLASRC